VRLGDILAIPWFLPGIAASLILASLLMTPVQRALRTGPALSWALIVSLGFVLSATLTPAQEALDFGTVGSGSCDLSRVGLAPLRELLRLNETSLNVLLFVPLGVSIAFLPRSRLKAAILVAAIALPFAVEATQLLVLWLDRACESADVVDNLTGLALGLGGGVVAGRLAAALARRPR
jgi:glycopeptide antibiotics resistance protein